MSDIFDDHNDDDAHDELVTTFNRAAEHIQQIHMQLKPTDLLELYAFYKQSTCGKCNAPKPGLFNLQGRSKWESWNNLGDLHKIEAMKFYIKKVTEISPCWENKTKDKNFWVSVSTHTIEPENEIEESKKTAFEYIKENNLIKLKEILKLNEINKLDDSGMGLIHWAADRNAAEILEYLLNSGANVNLQDNEGQTALHYASSCGQLECIKTLLQFGANKNIKDKDEQTCVDVAYDSDVRALLEN